MIHRTLRTTRRTFTLSALAAAFGAFGACESKPGSKPSAPVREDAPVPESEPVAPPANGSSQSAAAASNAFGAALFPHFTKTPGNFAYSAASLSVALSMTYAGARGETASQMAKVLRVPAGDVLHASWATVMAGWQAKEDGYEIATANRLFGEKNYRFEAPFVALTKEKYGAPLEPRDFQNAPEEQRGHINRWVQDRTRDRIADLLPGGSITNDTRLVLVNAIYLRATWKDGFDADMTAPAEFHVDAAKNVQVPMMRRAGSYAFARVDGAKLIELPYRGERMSMVALLPDAKDGLPELEKTLTDEKLQKWIDALSPEYISVNLPKFTIDPPHSTDLGKTLESMGMALAFDRRKADFTGIANPPNPDDRLYIGNVFHKVFVAVDEQGTEAAAASAVTMPRAGGAPTEDRTFRADHPFLFFIRDTKTGAILFVGRVTDPSV